MKRILLLSLFLTLLFNLSAFAQQDPGTAASKPDPTATAKPAATDQAAPFRLACDMSCSQ
jgi:hypothetical protein